MLLNMEMPMGKGQADYLELTSGVVGGRRMVGSELLRYVDLMPPASGGRIDQLFYNMPLKAMTNPAMANDI